MLGERLKLARKAAGLSQRELAGRVGVSAMAISYYERGENWPSSDVLLRLSEALDVRADYFLRPVQVTVAEPPLYRCRASMPARERDRVMAQAVEWAQRYLEVLQLFRDEPARPDLPTATRIDDPEEAEDVAERIRSVWGLGTGPLGNLVGTLEDRNAMVGSVSANDGFDAMVLMLNVSIPAMVVRAGVPGDRQRFSLAHEIGHLLISSGDDRVAEKAAHRFAAALLVPRETARKELGSGEEQLTLGRLYSLKHKYGLSMQAWIRRAKDVEAIGEDQAIRLLKTFQRRGWRKQEPYEPVCPERPERLRRLVYRALAEDLVSRARAAELLGISTDGLASNSDGCPEAAIEGRG